MIIIVTENMPRGSSGRRGGHDKIPSVHAKHRILLLYLRIPFRCCVVLVLFDGLRQQQQYSGGIIKMSLGMVMLTLSTKTAEEDNGRTAEISLYLRLLAIDSKDIDGKRTRAGRQLWYMYCTCVDT